MSAIMVKMAYLAPTRLKCSGPLDHIAQSLTKANRNWQTKYGVEKKTATEQCGSSQTESIAVPYL